MNQTSIKIEANKENSKPCQILDYGFRNCDQNNLENSTPSKPGKLIFDQSSSHNSYIVSSPQQKVSDLLEKAKDKKTYCALTAEEFLSLSQITLNYFCQNLRDEGVNQIFSTVFSMNNLTSLSINLQINEITCLLFGKINYYCENLTYLKLDLGSNNIGQENGIKCLEDCTKNLKNLKQFYMDLRWNNLTDSNCEQIGLALKHLKQLQEIGLFLNNNKITYSGVNFLCRELQNISKLKKLQFHLSQNQINDEGAILLSQCLENLTDLETIDISLQDNSISNQGSIELCKSISNLYKVSFETMVYYTQLSNLCNLPTLGSSNNSNWNSKKNPSKIYLSCQDIVKQNIMSNKQHALILTAYNKHILPLLHYQPQYQHWDILY